MTCPCPPCSYAATCLPLRMMPQPYIKEGIPSIRKTQNTPYICLRYIGLSVCICGFVRSPLLFPSVLSFYFPLFIRNRFPLPLSLRASHILFLIEKSARSFLPASELHFSTFSLQLATDLSRRLTLPCYEEAFLTPHSPFCSFLELLGSMEKSNNFGVVAVTKEICCLAL